MFGINFCKAFRPSSHIRSFSRDSIYLNASRFPEKNRFHQRPLGYEQGPLTAHADWSYADGTPAPLTGGRREERIKQMNLAKKIIQLLAEVDFAVERHRKVKQEREDEERRSYEDELKPKGGLMNVNENS